MKLLMGIIMSAVLLFMISGCGTSSSGNTSSTDNHTERILETITETEEIQTAQEDLEIPKRDLPEGEYADIGEGSFFIVGSSGSTENGDEIIVYPKTDTWPHASIGYELWDMDGSVQTFIYVDGMEMVKEQVGAGFQGTIDFNDDSLWAIVEGDHKVEAIQYENNDPSDDMTFYRSAVYTVKAGTVDDKTADKASEKGDISVEKHLLNVDITVPIDFFTEEGQEAPSQESLDELAAKSDGIISYTLNDNDTVTCKITKDHQRKMLDSFKQGVDDYFAECTDPGSDSYVSSYQSISFNDDLSEITITVDADKYGGLDAFYALGLEYYGYYYQVFSGIPKDRCHVYVYYVDSEGKTIETADSDALFGDSY